MKKIIEVEKLGTVMECLEALATITRDIEEIRLQLEFATHRDYEWRQRAEFAFKKCKSIRQNICGKLAVLRQQEREQVRALHQQHNDLLIDEMKRYLPEAVMRACVHRAELKLEGSFKNVN